MVALPYTLMTAHQSLHRELGTSSHAWVAWALQQISGSWKRNTVGIVENRCHTAILHYDNQKPRKSRIRKQKILSKNYINLPQDNYIKKLRVIVVSMINTANTAKMIR